MNDQKVQLNVWVTQAERDKMRQLAEERKVSVGELVRSEVFETVRAITVEDELRWLTERVGVTEQRLDDLERLARQAGGDF